MANNRDSDNQGLTPLERYLAKHAKDKATSPAPVEKPVADASAPVAPAAGVRSEPARRGWQMNEDEKLTPQAAVQPAEIWMRFFAYFLDVLIVSFLHQIVISVSPTVLFLFPAFVVSAVDSFSWLLISFFYYGYFYSEKGASPGKMLLHLQILETGSGRRLGYWRAFLRETIGKMISTAIFGMGFLMAAFRSDRAALHDMIFDTRVVHR